MVVPTASQKNWGLKSPRKPPKYTPAGLTDSLNSNRNNLD